MPTIAAVHGLEIVTDPRVIEAGNVFEGQRVGVGDGVLRQPRAWRHLWNPSNFGVSAMLFLAGESVGSLSIQWGNHVWAMLVIWVIGAFIIWRLRRFHITATYVVAFIAFALLRSWATGSSDFGTLRPE